MKKIKIFECFAGIGAQHKALTNLKKLNKLDFEVVGISEWYISAIIGYTLIHYNNEFHSFDISNISLYVICYPFYFSFFPHFLQYSSKYIFFVLQFEQIIAIYYPLLLYCTAFICKVNMDYSSD